LRTSIAAAFRTQRVLLTGAPDFTLTAGAAN
jgi:hypothetical protein